MMSTVDDMNQVFCANVYDEGRQIAANGFPQHKRDLFMEQGVFGVFLYTYRFCRATLYVARPMPWYVRRLFVRLTACDVTIACCIETSKHTCIVKLFSHSSFSVSTFGILQYSVGDSLTRESNAE